MKNKYDFDVCDYTLLEMWREKYPDLTFEKGKDTDHVTSLIVTGELQHVAQWVVNDYDFDYDLDDIEEINKL